MYVWTVYLVEFCEFVKFLKSDGGGAWFISGPSRYREGSWWLNVDV